MEPTLFNSCFFMTSICLTAHEMILAECDQHVLKLMQCASTWDVVWPSSPEVNVGVQVLGQVVKDMNPRCHDHTGPHICASGKYSWPVSFKHPMYNSVITIFWSLVAIPVAIPLLGGQGIANGSYRASGMGPQAWQQTNHRKSDQTRYMLHIRVDALYVVYMSTFLSCEQSRSWHHIHTFTGIPAFFFTNKTTLSNKTYSLVADMQRDLHLVDCWTWSCLSEHLQNYWYATCNRWQNSHGSNAWLANKSSLQHQVQIPMQLGHQHLRRQRRESDNSVDPKWYLVSKF